MSPLTIASIKEQAGETPLIAAVFAQLQSRALKLTKTGKPYVELVFGDATGSVSLKIW